MAAEDVSVPCLDSEWSCEKCTFVNSVDDLTCTMCFQVRSSTRALPYTWQWLAQVDWIPFDAPCNEQIETAYQSGAEKVNLTRGFCASRPSEYTVHFGRKPAAGAKPARRRSSGARGAASASSAEGEEAAAAGEGSAAAAPVAAAAASVPAFTQRNNHSGMVRKVRRLANDDDALFVVLKPSTVARGDKCSICSEEWYELEEEAEGDAAPSSAAGQAAGAPASSAAQPSASASASSAEGRMAETCLTLHPTDQWPQANLAAVKLPKCATGHGFHRECIASWVKLKDSCPICAVKI